MKWNNSLRNALPELTEKERERGSITKSTRPSSLMNSTKHLRKKLYQYSVSSRKQKQSNMRSLISFTRDLVHISLDVYLSNSFLKGVSETVLFLILNSSCSLLYIGKQLTGILILTHFIRPALPHHQNQTKTLQEKYRPTFMNIGLKY